MRTKFGEIMRSTFDYYAPSFCKVCVNDARTISLHCISFTLLFVTLLVRKVVNNKHIILKLLQLYCAQSVEEILINTVI